MDKPKTPSWSPSNYEDFKPFLLSEEDPWKVKSTFNTKTILIRENYNKEKAKKHQEMAKMVKKRKSDDTDNDVKKRARTKETCKDEKKIADKETTYKKKCNRTIKLQKRLKSLKKLSSYKQRKTLQ